MATDISSYSTLVQRNKEKGAGEGKKTGLEGKRWEDGREQRRVKESKHDKRERGRMTISVSHLLSQIS